MVCTSSIYENIINVLNEINYYLKKAAVITNEEQLAKHDLKNKLKIKELQNIIEEVGSQLINHFENLIEEVKFIKKDESDQKTMKIIQIEQ